MKGVGMYFVAACRAATFLGDHRRVLPVRPMGFVESCFDVFLICMCFSAQRVSDVDTGHVRIRGFFVHDVHSFLHISNDEFAERAYIPSGVLSLATVGRSLISRM